MPAAPSPKAPEPEGLEVLLAPMGALIALVLPFVVLSTASDAALHEAKLFPYGIGGALILVGLGLSLRKRPVNEAFAIAPRGVTAAGMALAAFVSISALASASTRLDPLSLTPSLAALALFLAAASTVGPGIASRALPALMAVGAFTGLLATAQRFLGVFQLPLRVPEPRFLASALIGNPGDVGAALVLPGLLLWSAVTAPRLSRNLRILAGAGFLATVLGLGATEAIAPLTAMVAGLLAHVLLDVRRRGRHLLVGLVLVACASAFTGLGGRAMEKLRNLRAGNLAEFSTQRDIGVLAALEMIRSHPATGVGPGSYENAFVPSRLAAEERSGRRLVHFSESAHFENAHNEPLTLTAECGIPAALIAMGLTIWLAVALLRNHLREKARDEAPGIASSETLLVCLLAFLVLGLGGFPLRIPMAAGPMAFLAGLAVGRLGTRSLRPGRPAILLVLGAALFASTLARGAAARYLAAGEETLRAAALSSDAGLRGALLSGARVSLTRAATLRPRGPAAWLALGSVERLEGNLAGALDATNRSFALEERAETTLNLGLIALEGGRTEVARAYFVRAVWIFPRLLQSIPQQGEPGVVEIEVRDLEARFPVSRRAPPLPNPR